MAVGRTVKSSAPGAVKEKKKVVGPIETFTLNAETLAFVTERAAEEAKRNNPQKTFWRSVLAGNEKHGSVTAKQMSAIEKEYADRSKPDSRVQLKDKSGELGPINNKYFTDGVPRCFISGCRKDATVRVGGIGVCADDVKAGEKANAEYAASRT